MNITLSEEELSGLLSRHFVWAGRRDRFIMDGLLKKIDGLDLRFTPNGESLTDVFKKLDGDFCAENPQPSWHDLLKEYPA